MKICPSCKKTYTDNALNFCLEDGSVLSTAGADLPETVMMPAASVTSSSGPPTRQPASFGSGAAATQPAWNNPQQFTMQPPRKSSRTWLWLLGVIGVLVLLCGGGGVLFVGLAIYSTPEERTESSAPVATDKTAPATGDSTDPAPSGSLSTVDLSKWVNTSEYGTTAFTDGEFVMSSKQRDFYYVLCASDEFKSESATVSVLLRNIRSASSNLGYGLVFHSDPRPLQKGYALLIDTQKKKYRVVRHEPQKEIVVVPWTSSDAIKPGAEVNKLEVRHRNDMNELLINDQKITSLRNTFGYKGGVVGLYAADAVKVAFRDLAIAK